MNNDPSEILVLGVGGAGCNALKYLMDNAIYNMAFVAVNTDRQSLSVFDRNCTMLIGANSTFGRGTGGDPELGKRAAEENIEEIKSLFFGKNLLIILVGLGGGTGTGAAQVIAEEAKKADLLTLVFATMPFSYEGDYRTKAAKDGLERLKKTASSVVVLSNDKISGLYDKDVPFAQSLFTPFRYIHSSLNSIREIVLMPGIINLDYADLRAVLAKPCFCHIGCGEANGPGRVSLALKQALSCDLFEYKMEKTDNAIIYIVANQDDFKSEEAQSAMVALKKYVSSTARVYFGINYNSGLGDHVRIIVISSYPYSTPVVTPSEQNSSQEVPSFIQTIMGNKN